MSDPGEPTPASSTPPAAQVPIPAGLAEDLRVLHAAGEGPPAWLGAAILRRAEQEREALALRRRNRFRLQRLVAAAAGITLFVLVARLVTQRPLPGGVQGPAGGGPVAIDPAYDVTGDGAVDILDAFRLARLLDGGGAPASPDVTGDGAVDRADVDAIAMRAVRLDAGRAGGAGGAG